jgi:hypothetical protein
LSHNKERSEKICLNCGAHLYNRFCHLCGQENTEPKETVWGMISHFAYDITHFDGKFFSTVKYLLKKPGFLSLEHMKGRRARYLHPIRLYVFTSAFFFIIFFSLFNAEKMMQHTEDPAVKELKQIKEAVLSLQQQLPEEKDTLVKSAIERASLGLKNKIVLLENTIEKKRLQDSLDLAKVFLTDSLAAIEKLAALDSLGKELPALKTVTSAFIDSMARSKKEQERRRRKNSIYVNEEDPNNKTFFSIGSTTVKYLSQDAYDAVQKELPENKRDNWMERTLSYKAIELNQRVNKDEKGTWTLLIDRFFHTFPQVLFISLPLFALLLRLLYLRHKQFYYVDHALFSIHFYCASFIMLLVLFALSWLKELPYMSWVSILELIVWLFLFIYLYKAMRRFYGQGRFKTILKFVVVNIFSFFITIFISLLFFAVSLWRFH